MLEPGGKSMVVYGENGAGKSSFVDAVEYVLNDGKIGHLAHIYSGKHQERAVLNTHIPANQTAGIGVHFLDGTKLTVQIRLNGSFTRSGAETVAMHSWDYQRTVLRQGELGAFIETTKGEKYSALLPLLGLHFLELIAENLRQFAKAVELQSNVREKKAVLQQVIVKRQDTFGNVSDEEIAKKIQELHAGHCGAKAESMDPLTQCKEVKDAIDNRIKHLSADLRCHAALQEAAALGLKEEVQAVREASVELVDAAEPLLAEKLEVLQSTSVFISKLGKEDMVECPACGRSIHVRNFEAHVQAEQERLQQAIQAFANRKAAIATLCDSVRSLEANLTKPDVKAWREELAKGPLGEGLANLDGLNTEELRATCTEEDLKLIETSVLPLVDAAAEASADAPPEVQHLTTDKQTIEVAETVIDAQAQADAIAQAVSLIGFINALENGTREEIRERAHAVIGEITRDVQSMWSVLHPGEAIENVRLYLPDDSDKAIDIGLKFHGIEQDSPRLTLSEGYRNSLGLCIFLAMAKREAKKARPLFLDDVVISFDRNHRGMIVELLETEFHDRQVILLTHDRDWYIELRQRLDAANWIFKALMPYDAPDVGIRWSAKTSNFDDARARLKDTPDSAGNTARKIMDIELALRAERLKLKLPYLHREKNDHRTAHEFFARLIADGERCFKRKRAKDQEPYAEAIAAFRAADKLLLSWGNRSSHSFDLTPNEAEKLIEACETALGFFDCPECKKPVYKLDDASNEFTQCECGDLRWRYGKA